MPTCSACKQEKPEDQFVNLVTGQIGKVCEKCRARRRKNGSSPWKKRQEYNLKLTYGITQIDYGRMLAEQKGVCRICGRTNEYHGVHSRLVVDHDKYTGQVRGLLCSNCNVGLGMFEHDTERLENAMKYLGWRSEDDL